MTGRCGASIARPAAKRRRSSSRRTIRSTSTGRGGRGRIGFTRRGALRFSTVLPARYGTSRRVTNEAFEATRQNRFKARVYNLEVDVGELGVWVHDNKQFAGDLEA